MLASAEGDLMITGADSVSNGLVKNTDFLLIQALLYASTLQHCGAQPILLPSHFPATTKLQHRSTYPQKIARKHSLLS
jgi:hypothetical protein